MKISQLPALVGLSTAIFTNAIVDEDNTKKNNLRLLKQPGMKCTTYTIDGELILKNSAVFRSSRIDSISSSSQCTNIAAFAGGALGATFCSGDTFSIGATAFFDEHGNEMGYYTRSGMRVPLFDPAEGELTLVGNAFNAFVFENGDQLHFQGVDKAGAPTLVTAVAGGTGEYIGAAGEVTITDFLKDKENTFEVCLLQK
mmetsp:Transcript_29845/g.44123  ORF Transcript_29845/g.44123 Transcript_29845/m.44123 type:complete len:199 (+) Transcript_29845:69-665(+)|eukprot:CAMPEP_0194210662 /NCGR_PEP_ID=MMETSP0156-20130528/8915_1 /TAXON_ID=33649 /ORGANISM="Thalassionema nitzschioides, Strain L26-B" /LENGTH=198 /DNA_ID=CAMNT_0038938033 /DNA_START=47 /DNA_END=643 /DNA_ORIENTATION=+